MEQFQPNANNILDVLYNKKPKYLPLYEHHIDIEFIEKFTGEELIGYRETEPEYFFKKVTEFWKNNTYDAFDFEAPICDVFPEHGAIMGGKLGPIQTRSDFERYPFVERSDLVFVAMLCVNSQSYDVGHYFEYVTATMQKKFFFCMMYQVYYTLGLRKYVVNDGCRFEHGRCAVSQVVAHTEKNEDVAVFLYHFGP